MDTKFLFPHSFRKPAIATSALSFASLLCLLLTDVWFPPATRTALWPYFRHSDVGGILTGYSPSGTASIVALIASLLVVSFTKEKAEDEYIAQIRGKSLIWAAFANSIFLAVSFVSLYDLFFLYLCLLNLFSFFVFFNIRFAVQMRKLRKSIRNS